MAAPVRRNQQPIEAAGAGEAGQYVGSERRRRVRIDDSARQGPSEYQRHRRSAPARQRLEKARHLVVSPRPIAAGNSLSAQPQIILEIDKRRRSIDEAVRLVLNS